MKRSAYDRNNAKSSQNYKMNLLSPAIASPTIVSLLWTAPKTQFFILQSNVINIQSCVFRITYFTVTSRNIFVTVLLLHVQSLPNRAVIARQSVITRNNDNTEIKYRYNKRNQIGYLPLCRHCCPNRCVHADRLIQFLSPHFYFTDHRHWHCIRANRNDRCSVRLTNVRLG